MILLLLVGFWLRHLTSQQQQWHLVAQAQGQGSGLVGQIPPQQGALRIQWQCHYSGTLCLGQGPALEHLLRLFEAELKQRGQVDRSVPTLSSRIAQLKVLNNKEREEMRKLGLKPVEPPLVKEKLQISQQLQPNKDRNPMRPWE